MNRNKRRPNTSVVLLSLLLGLAATQVVAAPAPAKSGPIVQVVTYYFGMPASSIEKTITNRIERWVNQTPGVTKVVSRSLAGVSIVRVSFRGDIDADAALKMMNTLALSTFPTLPPKTLPSVVSLRALHPVGVLAVYSAGANEGELTDVAQIELREWLKRIEGTVAPVVLGSTNSMVSIRLDQKKLQACNLSMKDVFETLRRDKEVSRGNAFGRYGEMLRIDIFRDSLNLNELKTLPILGEGKKAVRLGDIGRIEYHSFPQRQRFRFDGRSAVGVLVYAKRDTKPKVVSERISNGLAAIEKRIPKEVKLRWTPFGIEGKRVQTDDGLLTLHVRAPSNSPLAETEKRVAAVGRLLEKNIPIKEREAILSEVGVEPDSTAAYTSNSGPMDAAIFVQLSGERHLSAAAYAAKLRRLLQKEQDLAALSFRFASQDMPAPVDIRITGGKDEEQRKLVRTIRLRLIAIQGAVDVDIAQRADAPYLLISTDRAKATAVGLAPADVLKQALGVLSSRVLRDKDFWIDDKTGDLCSVSIPFSEVSPRKLEGVLEKEVTGAALKQPVKLSSLVTLKRITEAVEIDHDSLQRVLDVRANIEGRNRRDVIADIRKMLQGLSVPEGVKVELVE